MKIGLFWILLVIAFLLEVSVAKLPIVLDMLAIAYIYKKESWVFAAAFLFGLLIDILLVRPFGQTVLFFLLSLFLIFLYERKYEVVTKEFIFFFSLLAGFVYLRIFQSEFLPVIALANSLVAVVVFLLLASVRRAVAS